MSPLFSVGGFMSFCLRFKRSSKYMNTADEIIIQYKYEHIKMAAFLREHSNQRIIIDCTKDLNVEELIQIKEVNSDLNNYAILLTLEQKKDVNILREAEIPFFFDYHCNSWEALHGLIKEGVSDIYITDSLGFELDKVSALCKKNNIKIRAFCNVCQSIWKETDTFLTFFIRPDDIDLYAHYIDVFEFFGELKHYSQDVLYEIYAKQKHWFGPLNEIILGFNSNLDNRYIIPNFALKRIRCNRSCMKGGNCGMCYHMETLAETLKDKGFYLKPIHKKEEPFDN